jgi:hypothetical protein
LTAKILALSWELMEHANPFQGSIGWYQVRNTVLQDAVQCLRVSAMRKPPLAAIQLGSGYPSERPDRFSEPVRSSIKLTYKRILWSSGR